LVVEDHADATDPQVQPEPVERLLSHRVGAVGGLTREATAAARPCAAASQGVNLLYEPDSLIGHVNQDGDFLGIHRSGTPYPGTIYCVKEGRSFGEIIQALVEIWEIFGPANMANRVEFI
jgi:hypothetical protein